MKHSMKLYEEPFEKIRRGEKTIEVRCMDEKRKTFKLGDMIEFHKIENPEELLVVKILELYQCKSFRELYSMFPAGDFGHEGESVDSMVADIRDTYSEEREIRDGVLGIRVEVVG